jgi:hypothetical protein
MTQITQGLENIESTFREDQFKSAAGAGNAGGQEMTALERVSHENNLIWKQAVRLALSRSIVSAKLIIRNDKEISSQKKEQLLTVDACNPRASARSTRSSISSKASTIRSSSKSS